jgi:class 3 adenylate cyclase
MKLSELGQRIRAQREKCRLRQNDLAAALQVSPQAVSKWERGENAPDITLLAPLAKLLGVSADWLLGGYAEDRDVFEATVLASGAPAAREMSETMRPREFAAWTNGVCFAVTEAVLRHGGVPIKFIGPGILCFFAGVEHAARAVRAAMAAKAAAAAALKIGIACGRVYFGPVGHPDYAQPDIMGEAVSIALLGADWAASNTDSGIVVCEAAAKVLAGTATLGKLRRPRFQGVRHAVKLYEVTKRAK